MMRGKKEFFLFLSTMLAVVLLLGAVVQAEDYDLGGRTIRYLPLVALGGVELDQALLDRIEELEEKYNFEFEFVDLMEIVDFSRRSGNMYQDIINAILSGKIDIFDFPGDSDVYSMFKEANVFYPLDTILGSEYLDELPEMYRPIRDALLHNGRQITVPAPIIPGGGEVYPHEFALVVLWNKEIFDKLGLITPYELQESGQWTWDAMMTLASQAARDIDGDGKTDQFGIAGLDNAYTMVVALDAAGFPLLRQTGDRLEFAGNNPLTIGALQVYQNLIFIERSAYSELLYRRSPFEVFNEGGIAMLVTPLFEVLFREQSRIIIDAGMVLLPKGDVNQDHVIKSWSMNLTGISILEQEPEAVLAIFREIFQIDQQEESVALRAQQVGRGGDVFRTYNHLMNNWIPAPEYELEFATRSDIMNQINRIINQRARADQVMRMAEPALQRYLDRIQNQ